MSLNDSVLPENVLRVNEEEQALNSGNTGKIERQEVEFAHFKENTLSHPNLSVKFCPVAYHLRSEMGAYVFI
jgi:hypothetical protein